MLLNGVDWYLKQQAVKAADSDENADDDTDDTDDDDRVYHPTMIQHYELFHAVNAFQEHVFLLKSLFLRLFQKHLQTLSRKLPRS